MGRSGEYPSVYQMLALSSDELARVDPVVMNLVVARGIPALADLDVHRYVEQADAWARDCRKFVRAQEVEYRERPSIWHDCLGFWQIGTVARFMHSMLRVAYWEDQRGAERMRYTNPSDLFLNGVMDARRGTCGNMALLNVVLGRRLGLPVSLASVWAHFICRYDDGLRAFNIESTAPVRHGFAVCADAELIRVGETRPVAVACGSDLRAVTPLEMLGLFLGLRARYFDNIDDLATAERDYLLARHLFPQHRQLQVAQMSMSVANSRFRFDLDERGHPLGLNKWLNEHLDLAWCGPFPRHYLTNPTQIVRGF